MQIVNPLGQREIAAIRENLKDTFWIGLIGIGVLVITRWTFPISHAPSVSMEPTIKEDSKVLVNNLSLLVGSPERGVVLQKQGIARLIGRLIASNLKCLLHPHSSGVTFMLRSFC